MLAAIKWFKIEFDEGTRGPFLSPAGGEYMALLQWDLRTCELAEKTRTDWICYERVCPYGRPELLDWRNTLFRLGRLCSWNGESKEDVIRHALEAQKEMNDGLDPEAWYTKQGWFVRRVWEKRESRKDSKDMSEGARLVAEIIADAGLDAGYAVLRDTVNLTGIAFRPTRQEHFGLKG
jgi:hypothetical protein